MNNILIEDPIFNKLQFTQDWIDAGIIDSQSLAKIKEKYLEEKDDNYEHYRWFAFRSFLKVNPKISAETLHKIYILAKKDPDYGMGRSMRFQIIKHINCPVELIDIAIEDEDRGLSKQAMKLKEIMNIK
ncbi:MAG: hypothetical protein ACRC80_26360 [Waterburya sp.]